MFNHSRIKKGNQRKIAKLKDIHKGKRAFIVCNGPSLSGKDLDTLFEHNEISFACNKINNIFGQTCWRPTYYTIMDEPYQFSLLSTMNAVPAEVKFFRQESYCVTRKVKGNSLFLNADGKLELLDNPKFSDDISDTIYTIATVTYAMLQIAVYMGIKELYIIGCDNSYKVEKKPDGTIVFNNHDSYFKGAPEDKGKVRVISTWQNDVAYKFARKYADMHNIKIFNATRGGCLEVFERVDFDTLF